MSAQVHESLTQDQVDAGLRHVVRDGVASHVMATLTGGAFIVALALGLGATPLVIGVLAAIVPLAQVSQLAGVWLVETVRERRKVVVVAALVSRALWLVVALTPFLPDPRVGLGVMVVALTAHYAAGGIVGTGWNSWMRALVPEDRLGRFFSRRLAITTAVGIPLYLAAGYLVDVWPSFRPQAPLEGFSVLFVLGALAGILGTFFLWHTPEPTLMSQKRMRLRDAIREPLRDRNFRNLIVFFSSWGFAMNLAAPFFTVYLLERLGYSMTVVVGLIVLSQVAYFFALRLWGQYTDRFSNRSVLGMCVPLFFIAVLGWTFTTLPEPHRFTFHLLVVIHILIGIATSGTTLAAGNIALKLAPRGQATAYLATNSLVHAVTAGVAPIIGGTLATYFARRRLTLNLEYEGPLREVVLPTLSLSQWDFFFLIAFLLGFYVLHRLSLVQESGYVKERVVLGRIAAEVLEEMRNLSTAAGVRGFVAFPITLRTMRKRGRRNDRGRGQQGKEDEKSNGG